MLPRAHFSPRSAAASASAVALLALLALACLLSGCSAEADLPQAATSAAPSPDGLAAPTPAAAPSPPALAAPSAGMLAALPALSELSENAPRAVSDAELELPGDLVYEMSESHVSIDMEQDIALFSPPAGQLAWTIQQFSVGMFHEVGSVGCTVSGIEDGENVWIFVSDFPSNRWKALPAQGNGSSSIDLGSVEEVYSDGQSMFVAIVSFGSSFSLETTSVVLTDVEGFPGWYHNWGTTGWEFADSVAVESDGNVLFAGQIDGQAISGGSSQERRLGLLRFSAEGELLSSRSYTWPSPADELGPADITYGDMLLGSGGEVYLFGSCYDGVFGSTRAIVLRLDSDLNPVWSRLYYQSSNSNLEIVDAAFDGSGNLVCAGTRRGDGLTLTDDALLLVINPSSGDLIVDSVAVYGDSELQAQETILSLDVDPVDNRAMLTGYIFAGGGDSDAYSLSFDGNSGGLQWAASFGIAASADTSTAVVHAPEGRTIVASKLEQQGPGLAYNTLFLTVSSTGEIAGLHSYSDSTADGIYVSSLSTAPLGAGFIALGSRFVSEPAFVSPTSIIPIDYSMVPLGGTDYSFTFVAAEQTDTHLYCASYFTADLQQSITGTTTSIGPGSCSEVIGVGSFFSISASNSDAGLFFEPFEAVDEDVVGTLDGSLTPGNFDMFAAGLEL